MKQQTDIVIQIYNSFASTQYGQKLANKIRYERYNLGNLSNSEWVSLLGADVNNLLHMLVTYRLAQDFVAVSKKTDHSFLTQDEEQLLYIAAIIHDQAEAVVGDVTFSDKLKSHEELEHEAFKQHAADFSPGLSSTVIKQIAKARDIIVFNSQTMLGELFNIIERLGYLRTGLRAYEESLGRLSAETVSGLQWLALDVFSNQISPLVTYSKCYWGVQKWLRQDMTAITNIFPTIQPEDFSNYRGGAEEKRLAIKKAQSDWQEWLKLV